jgi:glucuronoarabinoxylan endo-1,4-beta-xylanase
MNHYISTFLIIFSLVICQTEKSLAQNPAVIDFGIKHQSIDGFGASTAWHGRISETEANVAFGNEKDQLGLTILRVKIDPGGINEWGTEMYNSKKALARGAMIVASPWTPPASMKTNNSKIRGELKPSEYGNYVAYLNDFIDYLDSNQIPLSAISLQNEPNITVSYESCDWSPSQLLDFCKNFAGGIKTIVIVPEAFNFDFGYSDPILEDSTARSHIAIIGGHLYGTSIREYKNAADHGKKVWMTEHYYDPDDINTCMTMAREIQYCLVNNMNAYIWWYLRQPGCNLITSKGKILKKGYVMAQFSKFIRPGYYRVETTNNPQPDVYTCAFSGDKKVIIAINKSTLSKNQQFDLQNDSVIWVSKYTTSETKSLSNEGTIDVTDGSFSTVLDPGSITTFVSTNQPTVGIINNQNKFSIQIFSIPSEPGNFSLTIDGLVNKFPVNMKIINLEGKVVHEQMVFSRQSEITTNLKPAIYLLKLTDGSTTFSKKFIVK